MHLNTPLGSSSPLDEDEPAFLINGSFLDNLKLALAPLFSLTDSFYTAESRSGLQHNLPHN
jgi:hypothetical protein